jgi:glutamine amidotransferase
VIALIDYGAGNLTSVKKALTFLGADFVVPASPAALRGARGVIVPGVGHFAATAALEGTWYDAIAVEAQAGKPLLGICLGMQWLFEGSDEAPEVRGLGVMQGRITRLKGDAAHRMKVPHVGWNALEFARPGRLLAGLETGAQVYFTHSFAAPVTPDTAAATTHCSTFASVVERDNIFGVQFHPEKSSDAGLAMIRNFLGACGR